MSDLDKFLALYKGFGIDLGVIQEDGEQRVILAAWPAPPGANLHPLFGGYQGFYTRVRFDAEGKFLGQDFYE